VKQPPRKTDLPGALQAQVLHGVLPYLQRIHGKTFVVVCEGEVLTDPALRSGLGRDVALLHLVGLRLVLVSAAAVDGLSALFHQHEDLVGLVNQHGCRAVGITGADGGPAGLAGGLLQRLHARGFVPVVMPVIINAKCERQAVEADELAAQIAQGLAAEKLLFIGDARGALDRDGHLLADLSEHRIAQLRKAGTIAGSSLARLEAAAGAVSHGVKSAHIIGGRRLHALLLEVLSSSGEGTMVLPDKSASFLEDSRRYMD
jgi:acetylglutamate kinase